MLSAAQETASEQIPVLAVIVTVVAVREQEPLAFIEGVELAVVVANTVKVA